MSKLFDKNGAPVQVGDLIKFDADFWPPDGLTLKVNRINLRGKRLSWVGEKLPPAEPTPQLIDQLNHRFVVVK